jgi:hypothetical protein
LQIRRAVARKSELTVKGEKEKEEQEEQEEHEEEEEES